MGDSVTLGGSVLSDNGEPRGTIRGAIEGCEFGAGTDAWADSETDDEAEDTGRRRELSTDASDGRRSSSMVGKCKGEGCRGSGRMGGDEDIVRGW